MEGFGGTDPVVGIFPSRCGRSPVAGRTGSSPVPAFQPSNGDVIQANRSRKNPGRFRRLAGTRDLPRPPLRPHRSRSESCSPGGCGDSSLRSRDDDAQVGEGADSGAAAPFRGDLARRGIRLIRDHEWEGPRISPMLPLASCALNVACRSLRGQVQGRPWRRPNG